MLQRPWIGQDKIINGVFMRCTHAAVLFESQNVIFLDDKIAFQWRRLQKLENRKRTVSIGHIVSCAQQTKRRKHPMFRWFFFYFKREIAAAARSRTHTCMHLFTKIRFLSSPYSSYAQLDAWIRQKNEKIKKDYTTHCIVCITVHRECA